MMTEEYDDKAGRRVWLSRSEVEQLLGVADDPLRKVAFRLGAEVGLRSHEALRFDRRTSSTAVKREKCS